MRINDAPRDRDRLIFPTEEQKQEREALIANFSRPPRVPNSIQNFWSFEEYQQISRYDEKTSSKERFDLEIDSLLRYCPLLKQIEAETPDLSELASAVEEDLVAVCGVAINEFADAQSVLDSSPNDPQDQARAIAIKRRMMKALSSLSPLLGSLSGNFELLNGKYRFRLTNYEGKELVSGRDDEEIKKFHRHKIEEYLKTLLYDLGIIAEALSKPIN